MFFWFIATSIWSVWFVFRDPKFDYRLLAIASLIPDLIDGISGRVGPLHSVITSIAVLFAIMIATAGRRPIRQRLLAIPIGMFMHLIYDGAFTDTKMFWWPVTSTSIDLKLLLSVERGPWNLPLEIIGITGCLIAWRYFSLSDTTRRRLFFRVGQLHHDRNN